MKKIFITLIITSIFFLSAKPSHAVDISVGASSWYATWDFEQDDSANSPDFGSTFLYGPLLSVKFTQNISISSVFLYGKFDVKDSGNSGGFEMTRMDSDTLLNYNINRYFKIFAGFKYMSFSWSESGSEADHSSLGGGMGIGIIIPLFNNFYLLGNLAGIYQDGTHESSSSTSQKYKRDFEGYGVNSNLSLAYYIVSASVTISLGFRYQYFKENYDGPYIPGGDNADYMKHTFYGATLSAVYSFDL